MKIIVVLATLFACALAFPGRAPTYSGPVWPRLPLGVILKTQKPVYDQDNKIVGGEIVRDNSIPFQTTLMRYSAIGGALSLSCGGSVLNDMTILNAAHCVSGSVAANYRIVAGEIDLSASSGNEQVMEIRRFIPHENYGSLRSINDISLIELTTPLTFNANVQPITLPTAASGEPAVGTNLIVSGFGTTSSGGQISNQLRKVKVPVVSDADCKDAYGQNAVTDHMICAGLPQGGVDSCQGDSGGPLFSFDVVNGNDVPKEQIGIVSWGQGCALPGYPGVYTQVSYFLDWIQANDPKNKAL